MLSNLGPWPRHLSGHGFCRCPQQRQQPSPVLRDKVTETEALADVRDLAENATLVEIPRELLRYADEDSWRVAS